MIDSGSQPDLKRTRRQRIARADGNVDRLPPNEPKAEQGILGCILLSPNECMGECIEKLKDGKEVFYDLRNQELFEQLAFMYNNRLPIDVITVRARLKDLQIFEQIGGDAYLSHLQDEVPSAANLSYYLDIVREKFLLRKFLALCGEISSRIYEFEGEVDQLCDEVERDVLKIAESRIEGKSADMKSLVSGNLATIENFFSRNGEITGLATGFGDFDKMTDGLHDSEMIVIAARPSMGKTSLAMNIVEHVVLEKKLPVGVFSLEMSAESLSLRMICSVARVNLRSIREGFMSQTDFPKLQAAAVKLSKAPLHIDDTAALSILQLRAKARRMYQQHGIKLIVVDYLQLLHAPARGRDHNRQQEVSDISSGLKALAKELKVPVLVLAQLNRELERREGKPRLSDLRESGSIEQDADLVGLLYKPGKDDDAPEEKDGIPVNLLIAKQRNGPTGDVNLTFLKSFTRFENAAKINDEDMPPNVGDDRHRRREAP